MSVTRRPSSIHQTQHTLSNRARERGKKNRERDTEYDGNENQKQNVKVHQPILLSDFRTDHVSKQSRRVGTRIQAEGPVEVSKVRFSMADGAVVFPRDPCKVTGETCWRLGSRTLESWKKAK
ncbi:predicted protein [Histoplasma capsulatum G186AR]|uniref:Uncharacterized protein n=1 Tax=Ajellomyces capsulatus (strain G186AR / H82 / ATCC MYA-2454 / RMSCC 2432) TaxID=447093 RepID=C0NU83_AJECG|nr:uncharacterized protein HCBG_06914 [Histoplasma capsulatum G186AR]EEH04963.1 predicted protein [Histoplasma capsulatum G186AR]